MRGTFDLVLLEQSETNTIYGLRGISFVAAGSDSNTTYRIAGEGIYRVGTNKNPQEMTLQTTINDSTNAYVFTLDTNVPLASITWPMISISLIETQQATLTHVYHLDLLAAPMREIWFSTVAGLTASKWQSPTNRISAGDLISDSGHVVRSNGELLRRLGIMPGIPELGIDAVDIAPGGEILFSLNQDIFSETLGWLHHGDVLSERGTIFRRNEELMAAFNPQPAAMDFGLDAVQAMTNGDIYFSITTNLVSPQIGMLFRGDILSDKGSLIKSHQQLLSNFHLPPALVDHDYGLDALHVWPNGEIWFSTEEGFDDTQFGPILAGDLLSDQGFVVFRNLELVSAFAPLEDLANFGLDALYIVTDTISPASAPPILSLEMVNSSGDAQLQWSGPGRAFQLERANELPGTFVPASPILPDLSWTGFSAAQTNGVGFYRLRQW